LRQCTFRRRGADVACGSHAGRRDRSAKQMLC
jgi:hypothetical protein